MKETKDTKDTNYSLLCSENYNEILDCGVSEVTKKYGDIIIDYYTFIIENLKTTNRELSKFIMIRGLDTITNVFSHLLYYTKNLNLTYFHCQKSFYFYVEFVGQISGVEKTFLQLTSRDATTYVYKKTVFDVKPYLKKPTPNEEEFKTKLDVIQTNINITQTYLLKIIQTNVNKACDINVVTKLVEKINNLQNKINMVAFAKITDILYHMVVDTDLFFEINDLLINQISKSPNLLKNAEKKYDIIETELPLNDTPAKFIDWLLSSH